MRSLLLFKCILFNSTALAIDGYIQNEISHLNFQETIINSSASDFSQIQNISSFGLEGNLYDIDFRSKLTRTSLFSPKRQSTNSSFEIQELSKNFSFGSNWIINLGKTQLNWDESISLQPLGFFQKDPEISDITDTRNRSEGLPLVAINYVDVSWNASLVYSNDFESDPDGFNRGLEQWAGLIAYNSDKYDLSLVFQKPNMQYLGIGGNMSYHFDDDVVIYGSFFTRKGTRRPFNELLNYNNTMRLSLENPYSSNRRESMERFNRYVLGIKSTIFNFDYNIEYSHDDRGLNNLTWERFLSNLNFHSDLASGQLSQTEPTAEDFSNESLGQINLAYNRQQFRGQSARQKYLFVFINRVYNQWSTSLFSKYDISSKSFQSGISLSRNLGKYFTLDLSFNHFTGDQSSEYGLSDTNSILNIFLKYQFSLDN